MAGVSLVVEQVVREGPAWRLVVDDGAMRVERGPSEQQPDVRLTSDRDTAAAIASGRRAALDAFMRGDLVIGGDIRALLDHREAFEALGDLFAGVREATDFG
jgi:predicted lipid carrier protein YhbT